MININKINNTNFLGYKNVIANSIKYPDSSMAMLTLKLDNKEYPDLDNYKKIQSLYDNKNYSFPQDTLTLIAYEEPQRTIISIDGQQLLTDKILKNLEKYVNLGLLDHNSFKEDEATTLKTYQFLANLTKRVANDNNLNQEKATFMDIVMETLYKFNSVFSNNTNDVNKIINQVIQKNKPQETAQFFNELIQKMMINYLK